MPRHRKAGPRIRAHAYANKKLLSVDPPLFCQRCCSQARLQRHHPDYSKPRDIQWLCSACHTFADHLRRLYEDNGLPIVPSPDGSPVIPLDRITDKKLLSAMWLI